jgi:hypothetical protein
VEFCITVEDAVFPHEVLGTNCTALPNLEFQVAIPNSPDGGEIINLLGPVRFAWSPATRLGMGPSEVTLNIWDVSGQDPIQVMRSQFALKTEEVIGVNAFYWDLMEIPLQPGESMDLVCSVTASGDAEEELLPVEERTSAPAFFSLHYPMVIDLLDSLTDTLDPPPCAMPDAGPDQVIAAGQQASIHLGTKGLTGSSYSWGSDPFGLYQHGSKIMVPAPDSTTRYGVTMVRKDSGADFPSSKDEKY